MVKVGDGRGMTQGHREPWKASLREHTAAGGQFSIIVLRLELAGWWD